MLSKNIFGLILAAGLVFGGAGFAAAQEEAGEVEGAEASGEAAGAAEAGAAEAGAAGSSLVPAEVQQQLDSVQKTVDDTAKQVQSVKEKGIVQTVWDNITAPIAAILDQISQILGSVFSIFGAK